MSDHNNNNFHREFIYTCPSKVFNDHTLSINELKLYMIVRSFMDTTGTAYPSNSWIANQLKISVRKTIDNINRLVEKGYLERLIIEGKRYLRIPSCPIGEQVDKKLLVMPPSGGHDATVTGGSDANVTQLDQSYIISKKIKERGKTARSQIPDDFCPDEKNVAFAEEHKIDLKNELGAFIDYYKAHGKKMANWQSAFTGWLRKSLDFQKTKHQPKKEHPVTASIREMKDLMRSKEFLSLSC